MQRLFVARQIRPDINLKDAIGKYEFSAVPKSLFTTEGAMLVAQYKSKMLQCIIKEAENFQPNESSSSQCSDKAVIIDGMAYLHSMQKPPEI
jgi:hypothetical protein